MKYKVADLARLCGVSPQAISKTLKKHPELNQFKTVEGRYIYFGEEVLNWFKTRYGIEDSTKTGSEDNKVEPSMVDDTQDAEKIRLLEAQVIDLEKRLKSAQEDLQRAEDEKQVAQSHVERLLGLLEREQAISMAYASRVALPEPGEEKTQDEETVIDEATPASKKGMWGRMRSLFGKKKGTV